MAGEDSFEKDIGLKHTGGEQGMSYSVSRPSRMDRLKALARKAFLGTTLGIAAAGGVKAEVPQKVVGAVGNSVSAARQVGEKFGEIGESRPTKAQIEALALLKVSSEDQIINAKVKQIREDGKVLQANIRNKPSSYYSESGEPSDRTGDIISRVVAGTQFKVIVVEGNNPRFGSNPLSKDLWLYVNNTDDPLKGGFIHTDNLNYDPKILQATPIRLKSFK